MTPARTLHFPTDRTIGHLSIAPLPHDVLVIDHSVWRRIPACGDVAIEASRFVAFAFRAGDRPDLSVLRDFQPTDLDQLSCVFCSVYDSGLAHLQHLTRLQLLDLTDTFVTGEGLRYLRGLPSLRVLRLDYSNVDETALPHLQRLGQLRQLSLDGTVLKRKHGKELRRKLPWCEIEF